MLKHNGRSGLSLRKKILISSLSTLLLLAIVMGTISVYIVGKLSEADSKIIMSQLCAEESLRFDNKLNIVKHSVDTIYEYSEELRNLDGGKDVFSADYEQHMKEFAIAVSNQTEGAMAVYFRYNPELVGNGTQGFFWKRNADTGRFEEELVTDLLQYNSSDVEHVGWYYIPKETGKALWMTPYNNKNLDVLMISYVIPLYLDNGEFLGVIGMDIDFGTILKEAHEIQIYHSGYVALVDLSERLIYFTNEGEEIQKEKLSNALYNHITTINKSEDLLQISNEKGDTSIICCRKLSNGMMMYVNVPKEEIVANRDSLMHICILITVMIFAFASIVLLRRIKRIVKPIEKLTEITKQYAEGDWSSQYICDTYDEVQRLSEGISQMARNTQDYISELNCLARTDAVTGVGNKTSYLELISDIQNNKDGKYNEYAVVVMDLNLLKKTNDTYGHEIGDMLIKETAKYTSRVFTKSPVFRIGGDEFVVILSGEEYLSRNELLKKFEEGMFYPLPNVPDVKISISFGMAEYPRENPDYESVFELADERMYQKKKEMKMERQD